MKDIVQDPKLIARCGLYCGACPSYRKGRCPGCRENAKASWCKVRTCCAEHRYESCADCQEHPDPKTCPKFHNFIARTIGWVLNSDRRACIYKIREVGREGFAAFMTERKLQSLPRR
ncbi:MAG: DUF3795 domain-containing protein [Deltaproteobacteria bacterium]|nr:DUF3795 domain-containing protein [Deltaproteobacteria bacterium]